MTEQKKIFRGLLPWILAGLHWCAIGLLHLDRFFFRNQERTELFWIPKILLLLLLIVGWQFLFHTVRRLRQKDPMYLRGAQIFCVYFPILMVLLLILWPGTFSWDDAITLNVISYYRSFFPEQHILTGLYQDVLLHLLPFPGGMIALQNLLIALCVSFCVVKLEAALGLRRLKNPIADILLKLLPFLLPPVIMYQFSGYRMGLYIFLELTVLVMLLCSEKEAGPWSWGYLLLFSFLAVTVTVWRTEALIYLPFLVVLLLLIPKATLPRLRKAVCIALILCGFFTVTRLQNNSLGSENYQLISLVRPCAELVRDADPEKDARELSDIDAVVSVDVICGQPQRNGEQLYWDGELTRSFTAQEYSAFVKALVRLAVKHPGTVLRERWNLFIEGSGITGESWTNVDTARFFDADYESGAKRVTQTKNWLAFRPIFPRLRKQFVYFLNGRTAQGQETAAGRLLFNAILPELILAAVWISLLRRRRWYPWLLCSAVLAKLGIVFLTQPSRWLMYVLSFYLLGYVCLTYHIWIRYGSAKGATL